MKELDLVPAFINKNKHISTPGVAEQLILNETRKTVKAFPHVGGLVEKQEPVLVVQTKHC